MAVAGVDRRARRRMSAIESPNATPPTIAGRKINNTPGLAIATITPNATSPRPPTSGSGLAVRLIAAAPRSAAVRRERRKNAPRGRADTAHRVAETNGSRAPGALAARTRVEIVWRQVPRAGHLPAARRHRGNGAEVPPASDWTQRPIISAGARYADPHAGDDATRPIRDGPGDSSCCHRPSAA